MGRWPCRWSRLYLPESWTEDRARCQAAGVPEAVLFATKPQIALELIAEVLASGVAPAPCWPTVPTATTATSARACGTWIWSSSCKSIPAVDGLGAARRSGKKRTRWQVREGEPAARKLVDLFAAEKSVRWHPGSWKAADGQTRHTRLAWIRVYLPGTLDRGQDHLEELWLVVDWPAGQAEAYHFYLAICTRAHARALPPVEPLALEHRAVLPARQG